MSPILAVAETPREQSELSFISADKPHALVMAAQTLVVHLAKGIVIDAPALRAAMEGAFGGSDAQGAWCWKDAYEAVEAAQVLFLRRYGPAMVARAANDPARIVAMLEKIGAMLPSETRRSEESHALQQFSTPLEFAYVASLAAGIASFRDTLDEARRFLRAPRETPIESRDRRSSECDTIALARKIWAASQPIVGTKAEAYLRARKITADLHNAPLRYHPALIYRESGNSLSRKLPALIAAVTDNKGEIRGIHRTFLDPEKNDKADVVSPRRSLGAILGNGVRFGAIDEFALIGEGIETVLSLKSVAPDLPMVAALSAGHLAAWEIPAGERRLIIASDNDRAGRNAARKLSERAEAEGVRVGMIVSRGKDFNDDLRHIAREHIRLQLVRIT